MINLLYLQMALNGFVLYTVVGLIAITLIDTVGSVASRKLNFKYVYLTPLSLITYFTVGYFVSKDFDLIPAIISTSILGIYDATIGWHFSLLLRANNGFNKEQIEQLNIFSRIIYMIGIALLFGYFGHFIAN